ncbi:MAG: TetR/AcrR family transcriptional regulator, partial [Paracoccaceae bacterium]
MNEQTRIVKVGRKYDQVLEGARDVFMADGFEGASVDDIARASGVSKATLYSYFPDKRLLFREVVRTECERQACEADDQILPDCEPSAALYETARRLMAVIMSDFSLRMFRICIAEAERFPELGREFYESGPAAFRARLAEYLREATGRGELVIADFDLAADQFSELCKANWLMRAVFCHERDFSEEEQDVLAREAVA